MKAFVTKCSGVDRVPFPEKFSSNIPSPPARRAKCPSGLTPPNCWLTLEEWERAPSRLEEWRAIRPTKKQVGGCAYDCMDKCVQACPAGFNAKRCGDLCAPQCHRHCGQ